MATKRRGQKDDGQEGTSINTNALEVSAPNQDQTANPEPVLTEVTNPEAPKDATPKKKDSNEPPELVRLSTGKWTTNPTTTIHCVDCGKERVIQIQDAFQVKRCTECQAKLQNRIRAEKRKQQRRNKAEPKKLAEAYRIIQEHEEKLKRDQELKERNAQGPEQDQRRKQG